tara:strand:+ start:1183 stop:1593 length:411 start_codon:yes stop_codon:yes gene_type:complete
MISSKKREENRQFILFIITGGTSAIINILSRVVLSNFFRFEIAILISYGIGMITAFVLAKRYVFLNTKKSIKKSFPAFALVNLISVLQTFFVSILIKKWLVIFFDNLSFIELISHSCGLGILVFTSFYGHKYITFK